LNTGAGWASRRWPTARFAEVARYLGKRHHLRSVVAWAGAEEQRWADEVIVAAEGFALMAPQTTLGELAALARRATMFIGSDTGPMHLATAMGTPCISLHGPTNGRRNGPYGEKHIVLQKVLLEGGSRERRNADNASMLAISVEDVCAACDRLIERARGVVRPTRLLEPLAA
jgi:ADP-heptose:LPS heptosyltransferase